MTDEKKASSTAEDLGKDAAREALARRLHATMEHLDPSGEFDWGKLADRDKEFFRLCIKGLLSEEGLVRTALQRS